MLDHPINKIKKKIFDPSNTNYLNLLEETKKKIQSTRIQLAKTATQEQFKLYWWMGERIVHAQERFGWGKSVVEVLAQDLSRYFGEKSYGFSPRNLWDMRRFYLEYKDHPNLRQLVAEIPWGQNLVIINKIKDIDQRSYYLNMTREMGWTRDTLVLQIKSQAYERHHLIKKQHNFDKALPQHLAEQADRTLKDIYMLDTLGLVKPVLESEIENRMVHKIKTVMLELGYGFDFMGN